MQIFTYNLKTNVDKKVNWRVWFACILLVSFVGKKKIKIHVKKKYDGIDHKNETNQQQS